MGVRDKMLWSSLLGWLTSGLSFFHSQDQNPLTTKTSTNGTLTEGKPFIVLVEGNVASGKSTFLKIMEKYPEVQVYPEPVELWQKVGKQNLLHDMYSKPKRWTSTFELFTTLTRTEIALKAAESESKVVLLERSLYSWRYCFVQMFRETGVLTDGEFALLDRWFHTMTNQEITGNKADLIVYIRSDPNILGDRIAARGRKEEVDLPKSFLDGLHQKYEDWLMRGSFPLPAEVVVINGNEDLSHFTDKVQSWTESIGLKSTSN